MEFETTISKNIRIAKDKAAYDASCRRLLSEKSILAWIMKSCMEEYRDCDVLEIAEKYIEGTPQISEIPVAPDETNASVIRGENTTDTSVTEGTVYFDVRYVAVAPVSGERIRLIINVEGQNDFYPGYPLVKRAFYYCSRLISSQYGTEFSDGHYENIKKVYSVWVCMNPPKYRKNTITKYVIAEENLIGQVKEVKAHYDLMTVVMICLGRPEEGADDENYTGVLKLLDVLFSSDTNQETKRRVLSDEFHIPMTQQFEREVSLMCNFSDAVERKATERGMAKGMAQGMAQGMAKGMAQGISKGIEQARINAIESLMTTMGMTAQEAMSALQIDEGEQSNYLMMIKK